MIDSVLKGNGNSRFLKSAVPAGTSWADALAMLQAGTFPIDFNGINTEGFQQVGTPLNKANLLKDATAAQIGLPPSTTPDGMFQALGNTGELHVWRKTVTTAQEIPAGYTLGDAESGTAFSVPNAGSQNYVTLQYGPSITVNDGGGVSLTSVTGSIEFKQYSDVSAIYDIRNNFVKAIPNGGSNSAFDGVIFVPNDCSFKNTAGIVTFGKFYRVNAYPKTPAGTTTTYPVSTNPNAYQEGDDAKPAGYVLGDVVTGSFRAGATNYTISYGYEAASELTVSDDGRTVSMTSPSAGSFGFMGGLEPGDNPAKIRAFMLGKFVRCTTKGDQLNEAPDTKYPFNTIPSDIVYIPSNAQITIANGDVLVDRYQPVTGYAAIPAGTTIEYLGRLGDKARVQVVSYVGTGTYGENNPNSLTFDFVPKMVIISTAQNMTFAFFNTGILSGNFANKTVFSVLSASITNRSYVSAKKDGKTISWYSTSSPESHFNVSGAKYNAIAIG
jgi:hypothetical protein